MRSNDLHPGAELSGSEKDEASPGDITPSPHWAWKGFYLSPFLLWFFFLVVVWFGLGVGGMVWFGLGLGGFFGFLFLQCY